MNTTTSFDPTSQANVTACAILLLGLSCVAGAAYNMGKFKSKDAYKWNASLVVVLSALVAIASALYIFFAYD